MEPNPHLHKVLTILIMDDESVVRDSTAALFRLLGHTVVTSGESADTINKFVAAYHSQKRFDLVILDFYMNSGLNGIEVLSQIRAVDTTVPVVVSSGLTPETIVENPESFGFSGCLAKPFRFKDLKQLLQTLFKIHYCVSL